MKKSLSLAIIALALGFGTASASPSNDHPTPTPPSVVVSPNAAHLVSINTGASDGTSNVSGAPIAGTHVVTNVGEVANTATEWSANGTTHQSNVVNNVVTGVSIDAYAQGDANGRTSGDNLRTSTDQRIVGSFTNVGQTVDYGSTAVTTTHTGNGCGVGENHVSVSQIAPDNLTSNYLNQAHVGTEANYSGSTGTTGYTAGESYANLTSVYNAGSTPGSSQTFTNSAELFGSASAFATHSGAGSVSAHAGSDLQVAQAFSIHN